MLLTPDSNNGGATAKSPESGWGTNSELSVYFGATYSAKVRTATREIPSATNSPADSGHKPNVGAIVGGVVGGVVALIAIIALVFLCLRSRRRTSDGQAQSADSNNNKGNDPHGPDRARKSVASFSASQGTTLYSPHPQSPSWSAQGSPPPPAAQPSHGMKPAADPYYRASPPSQHQISDDWGQPGEYVYHQTYYPPALDPSQSHMHAQSVEMPSVRSPANVSEMPELERPIPLGGHKRG